MRWSRSTLRLWLLTVLLADASSAAAEGTWDVAAGETLSAIALRSGVAVDELRTWNALDSDRLTVGQQLRLSPPPDAPPTGPTYRVKTGDTLSAIANGLGLELADLIRMNPSLAPDRIREGQVLRVGGAQRRVRHRIVPGDNLSQLARRFRTRIADILQANPGVSADRIRIGQVLTIYTDLPDSASESVGTPSDGNLREGQTLSPHPGYLIRNPERAFGTTELVFSVRTVFDELLQRFPRAPRVHVHDLSLRNGGPMTEHRSHQSGRDIDLAYMYKGCGKGGCKFKRVKPADLDVGLQWALLKPWLKSGQVEAMFVDYALQRVLYEEAKRDGARADELALWFQYPRGRTFPLGIVRHYPAHADHIHVRVACHKTDGECKTFRPLLMQAQRASR